MKRFFIKHWAEITLVFITIMGILIYAFGFTSVISYTALYLILNMILLWVVWRNSRDLMAVWLIAGSLGYVAEVIGVQTGLLFGDYAYGGVLGPKLFGVPILVGLLWSLVMSVIWSLIPKRFGWRRIFVLGATAVAYDFVLEFFAVKFDLWKWVGGIPLTNAIGWFLVASLIGLVYHLKDYQLPKTYLAITILPLHIIFFISLIVLSL